MSETRLLRFSLTHRIEHGLGFVVFTALVLTGVPQRFPEHAWARMLIGLFGGIGTTRSIHRVMGVVFALLFAIHLGRGLIALLRRRLDLSFIPERKDFTDAIATLKGELGMGRERVQFDRFDYKQKLEYWGLVLGSVMMIISAFALLEPGLVTRWLPGQLVPACKAIHGNEAIMAVLSVVFWHMYNAHLAPAVFPFDRSMVDGMISRERMEHEHPLELARMMGKPDVQGEKVRGSYYWLPKRWQIVAVPGKEGPLPAAPGEPHRAMPLLLVPIVIPFLAVMCVFGVPAIGYVLVVRALAGKVGGSTAGKPSPDVGPPSPG